MTILLKSAAKAQLKLQWNPKQWSENFFKPEEAFSIMWNILYQEIKQQKSHQVLFNQMGNSWFYKNLFFSIKTYLVKYVLRSEDLP